MSTDALDKLAADAESLDERLSISRPVCCACGKKLVSARFLTIETGATTPMHVCTDCADSHTEDGRPDLWLFGKVWQAVRAAIQGKAETPNPCAPVVRGRFQ